MPVYQLDDRLIFPAVDEAESGLLAVGGDLSSERLLLAYSQGIFPWYNQGQPILWHSPDPRMVVKPREIVVARSLRKRIRKNPYQLRADTAFAAVVEACARAPRPGQDGTWINRDIVSAYQELHELGYAHSIEAWCDTELVGGLYGVSLGGAFFGESMFATRADASKIAFVALGAQMTRWDMSLIDCQMHTDHLARFGATELTRRAFVTELEQQLNRPTRRGRWSIDADLAENLAASF